MRGGLGVHEIDDVARVGSNDVRDVAVGRGPFLEGLDPLHEASVFGHLRDVELGNEAFDAFDEGVILFAESVCRFHVVPLFFDRGGVVKSQIHWGAITQAQSEIEAD